MSPSAPSHEQDECAADAALVARMTRGDRSALGDLYARHAPVLLAAAHAVLRDRQESEDVIHDVFLEAWARCSSYDAARSSVRTWLLVRARSRAFDRARSKTRRQELTQTVVAPEVTKDTGRVDVALHDRLKLPSALAQMPEWQQHVIQLAYFEGLSTLEISSQLGIPRGTVKSRTHAALATLRGMLGIADE